MSLFQTQPAEEWGAGPASQSLPLAKELAWEGDMVTD